MSSRMSCGSGKTSSSSLSPSSCGIPEMSMTSTPLLLFFRRPFSFESIRLAFSWGRLATFAPNNVLCPGKCVIFSRRLLNLPAPPCFVSSVSSFNPSWVNVSTSDQCFFSANLSRSAFGETSKIPSSERKE